MANPFTLGFVKHRQFSMVTHGTPGTAKQLKPADISLSSITRSGVTATATAAAAHHLQSGYKVTIAGATPTYYNGTFTITVTGATTFTYTIAIDPGSNASGTLTASQTVVAQWAFVTSAASDVTLGPDVNADLITLTPDPTGFEIPAPNDCRFDISNWYVKSASASVTVKVLFV